MGEHDAPALSGTGVVRIPMIETTISLRTAAGAGLGVSVLGFALEPEIVSSPESARGVEAMLRRARSAGVTLFSLPEGAGADRVERLLGRAFPEPDPDLVVLASRSSAGLAAGSRGRIDPPDADAAHALARSLAETDQRVAPQRVRLVEWIPSEGDDEARLLSPAGSERGGPDAPEIVRRIEPGAGPRAAPTDARPGELLSGSLSLVDRRLLGGLERRAALGPFGFFARDPFGGGRLDGTRLSEAAGPRRPDVGPVRVRELEREFAPVLSLGFLTEGRRRTLAQAALRFVLHWPWVVSAIVPLPSPERLSEVLGVEAVPELTDAELQRLDALALDA